MRLRGELLRGPGVAMAYALLVRFEDQKPSPVVSRLSRQVSPWSANGCPDDHVARGRRIAEYAQVCKDVQTRGTSTLEPLPLSVCSFLFQSDADRKDAAAAYA